MARRTVLTGRQRSALFSLPQHEADLLRHYTLSDEDLQHIEARRRPRNKLGFALQLCVLRYPGRLLVPGEFIPPAVVDFIGRQPRPRRVRTGRLRGAVRDPARASCRAAPVCTDSGPSRTTRRVSSATGSAKRRRWRGRTRNLARRFVDACRQTRTILPTTTGD